MPEYAFKFTLDIFLCKNLLGNPDRFTIKLRNRTSPFAFIISGLLSIRKLSGSRKPVAKGSLAAGIYYQKDRSSCFFVKFCCERTGKIEFLHCLALADCRIKIERLTSILYHTWSIRNAPDHLNAFDWLFIAGFHNTTACRIGLSDEKIDIVFRSFRIVFTRSLLATGSGIIRIYAATP